ncbi:MAG: response regulator, partial [Thermodesulfobacteriota bacterium]
MTRSAQALPTLIMKILIVDDEQRIRSLLAEYFEYKGWEVRTAQDGKEAIAALRSASFDVVLSDIRMPGASGLEVLRETRQGSSSTQVLLMTGYRDLQSAIVAVNQGAFAYVEKPFDIHELHEKALKAFEAKHLSDQTEREMANLEELVDEKDQELSLLKERSKAILDLMPSMLVLVNEHGQIRDINELFLKVFDWYRGDLPDKHLCHGLRCPLS